MKNETEKRKKTWLDFGLIWSVLYLSDRYERVFTNLTVVADFTNVKLKLQHNFNHLQFFFFAIFKHKIYC
jgi:hypothetical protein